MLVPGPQVYIPEVSKAISYKFDSANKKIAGFQGIITVEKRVGLITFGSIVSH